MVMNVNSIGNEIPSGTFIYFDEFSRTDHEWKAFKDFLSMNNWNFRPIVANKTVNRVVFEITKNI